MALVMLPCELPWWSVVVRKITSIENTNEVDKILENMQKIHDLCKWVLVEFSIYAFSNIKSTA